MLYTLFQSRKDDTGQIGWKVYFALPDEQHAKEALQQWRKFYAQVDLRNRPAFSTRLLTLEQVRALPAKETISCPQLATYPLWS